MSICHVQFGFINVVVENESVTTFNGLRRGYSIGSMRALEFPTQDAVFAVEAKEERVMVVLQHIPGVKGKKGKVDMDYAQKEILGFSDDVTYFRVFQRFGKKCGFCYVEFSSMQHAEAFMAKVSYEKILGKKMRVRDVTIAPNSTPSSIDGEFGCSVDNTWSKVN